MEASGTTTREQWEIQYARFFIPPASSTTSTRSSSLRNNQRKRPYGTWLSSSSSTVCLNLSTDESISEIIIVISIGKFVQEEHILRKLLFSWPHVSCVSGFPPRGGRVILASYRDPDDLIQKFAMRFPSATEVQIFTNVLQKVMSGTGMAGPSTEIINFSPADYDSEISSQSDVALHFTSHRKNEGTVPILPLNVDYSNSDHSIETAQSKALPHSDLQSQIMRYMEDSSFQDMINKVEKIISGMGYEESFLL